MGALAGIMEAQYDTLREHGHSPSEASTRLSKS
jgi:ketol-acid reductoisomerase